VSTANKTPNNESVSLNAFKQPKAFYLIFSIELWERFGYYGLQGIMAVYLVKMLGLSEADSITLFSSFSARCYRPGAHSPGHDTSRTDPGRSMRLRIAHS